MLEKEIEKNLRDYYQLEKEERGNLATELINQKRLTSDFKNNFELWFHYLCDGWARSRYNIDIVRKMYFTKKEDITNYRESVIKAVNSTLRTGEKPAEAEDYPIVQLKET